MADFLLIYEGGDKDWMETRSPEEIQQVMESWGAWFQELETSGHLRNPGSALAPGGAVVTAPNGDISVDQSLPEIKELVGGYSVIAASSIEEATKVAGGCPFLNNNPTGSVVVRPILEM